MAHPYESLDFAHHDGEAEENGKPLHEQIWNHFGLVRAESMQLTNDPRFFQGNTLGIRLQAFGGLSLISGLLSESAMGGIMDMDKNMNPTRSIVGCTQLVSFFTLCVIFLFNMVAVYVGVAQPYHTIRLMTSGPTGLECATAYYLSSRVAWWRHFAISMMLFSLPLYVAQMGLRLVVKFDRANKAGPELTADAPIYADIEGILFGGFMLVLAIMVLVVHKTHTDTFREKYAKLSTPPALQAFVNSLAFPDVHTQANPSWRPWLDQ